MTPEQEQVFEIFHQVAKDYGIGGDGRAKRMVVFMEPEVRRRLKALSTQASQSKPARKRASTRRTSAATVST